MRRSVLAILLTLLPLSACKVERATGNFDGSGILPGLNGQMQALLDRSAAAWNAGDLEGFMATYDRSPSTTYAGGGEVLAGWEEIRSHYAPRFRPGAERDSLRFEDLRTRSLGQRHALAMARYVLHRDGEVTATGRFTLVVVRIEGAWRVIHDHSSADLPPAEPTDGQAPAEAGASGEREGAVAARPGPTKAGG